MLILKLSGNKETTGTQTKQSGEGVKSGKNLGKGSWTVDGGGWTVDPVDRMDPVDNLIRKPETQP